MEAKGRQELWTKQKSEVLAALRERAIIQSVESSNRIEGVTIEASRLRPIVLGKARPRGRPEEELAGYRRALDWIFSLKGAVTVTPSVIRRLHAFAQRGSELSGGGDAGEWKKSNNEIIENSPAAREECGSYRHRRKMLFVWPANFAGAIVPPASKSGYRGEAASQP